MSLALRLLILVSLLSSTLCADDWPQWRGKNRDGIWNETRIVERFETDKLEIRWKVKIGAGYSGPTVAEQRVYVTDRVVEPKQIERVHCFDSKSGKKIWSYEYDCTYRMGYDAGPRASVTIDDGRAYALGAMGHLHCFDAGTGVILWKRDLGVEYKIRMPNWGIAAAPIVVDDNVIVQIGGANGACVVAFDKKDGDEEWKALNDRASYSAPILIEQGRQQVLVCWTGDNIVGLDPEEGELLWREAFPPRKMVIGAATPVVANNRLFVSSFYDGSMMLALSSTRPAAARLWKIAGASELRTRALHSIIATPIAIGDYLYGVDSYGELRCLDARTGERVWESQNATPRARWSNIHMVRNGDRVWMFNERGELIITKLTPGGYEEISRAKLIEPTTVQLRKRGGVCWSHPAFADRHVFARNDEELVCASLEE